MALSETIPVKGFISICPVMKPESFSMETVISAKNRNLRGVFIEGENEIPVHAEEDMIRVFQKQEWRISITSIMMLATIYQRL